VTFGIHPTGPDTGYGYLKAAGEIAGAPGVKSVERFIEKPKLEAAEAMLAAGAHYWNAGIFLLRAGSFLQEAEIACPMIAQAAQNAVASGRQEGIRIYPDRELFSQCPSESVDYAVMEHSQHVATVPMSPGWSDLGSWDALAALSEGPSRGPVTVIDCENSFVRSDGLQIAALGLRDMIVVASGSSVLVLPKGRSQEVKTLLSAMEALAA
jgi:mannose-1-phosphate guanylyltransferase/mannose-1-phosphate guanylyltransferase/mannose-6-phosphate isomerase